MGYSVEGQTRKEYEKNFTRVKDIIHKSTDENGNVDKDKAIKLSTTQANRITNDIKALNRARAARDLGHEFIFEVFYNRAYDLGSVGRKDYRDFAIDKLLEDIID